MGEYTTKTRIRTLESGRVLNVYDGGSPAPLETVYVAALPESKRSRGNPSRMLRGHTSDIGGDFDHWKYELDNQTFPFVHKYGATNQSGNLCVCLEARNGYSMQKASTNVFYLRNGRPSLDVIGTKLVSRASPTAPQAGLLQALVELKREGLPSLYSALWRKKSLRGAGGDYLNYQFGWVPLISDVRKLALAVIQQDQLLQQFADNAGKSVRRRRSNPTVVTTDSTVVTSNSVYSAGPYVTAYTVKPSLSQTSRVEMDTWFSGSFRYYVPTGDSLVAKTARLAQQARYLYGIALDPSVVWNLLGWTWLIDWVFDCGDVISTFSDSIYNDQILEYGYVMRKLVQTKTFEMSSCALVADSKLPGVTYNVPALTAEIRLVSHERRQATPFGFGSSWTGFSPKQLAILAALGLSRS